MAGRDRMTIEEVVRQVLRDEHADVIRESVSAVAQQLMEVEISELIGAQHSERRPEERATHRNGYRPTALGYARGRDRAADPEDAPGQLLPELSAAAQALRAGARVGRPAGLRLRCLDASCRSARRVARVAHLQVGGQPDRRPARRASDRRFGSARWRAATRICSSTRRSRRSATAAVSPGSAS